MSSLQGLAETIARFGLFGALYTDRGTHYFHTPKAGGRVDKTKPTQVGRALGPARHHAHSVLLARGPRPHGALLRDACRTACRRSCGSPASSRSRPPTAIIADTFIADFNARFAVAPADPASAFLPYVGRPLEDVLCVQEERRVEPRQLRRLGRAFVPDPAAAAPPPLRQGDGARARLSRWPRRHLRWPAPAGALRPGRRDHRCRDTGRLTPLGAPGLWICGRRSAAHNPHRPISSRSGHLMCYQTRTF